MSDTAPSCAPVAITSATAAAARPQPVASTISATASVAHNAAASGSRHVAPSRSASRAAPIIGTSATREATAVSTPATGRDAPAPSCRNGTAHE